MSGFCFCPKPFLLTNNNSLNQTAKMSLRATTSASLNAKNHFGVEELSEDPSRGPSSPHIPRLETRFQDWPFGPNLRPDNSKHNASTVI